MRYSTLALTALASAIANAESITFVVQSDDKTINSPISSIHEGAGINYFLTGSSGQVFDLQDGVLSGQDSDIGESHVGVSGEYFAYGLAVSPLSLTFDGDKVTSKNFWACKNTGDPYRYSEESYIIAVSDDSTAPFAECTAVSLLKSSGSASSSSAVPEPSGWSNTTVTTDYTVTDYTTYCPASTTVTITTCSENKCAPHEVTVTEPTTITITGECVFPTPPASASTTQAPGTTVTTSTGKSTVAAGSTSASSTSVPVVSQGGAAKAAVGVAGFAGVLALLI